jgi:hypothetical protein
MVDDGGLRPEPDVAMHARDVPSGPRTSAFVTDAKSWSLTPSGHVLGCRSLDLLATGTAPVMIFRLGTPYRARTIYTQSYPATKRDARGRPARDRRGTRSRPCDRPARPHDHPVHRHHVHLTATGIALPTATSRGPDGAQALLATPSARAGRKAPSSCRATTRPDGRLEPPGLAELGAGRPPPVSDEPMDTVARQYCRDRP